MAEIGGEIRGCRGPEKGGELSQVTQHPCLTAFSLPHTSASPVVPAESLLQILGEIGTSVPIQTPSAPPRLEAGGIRPV